MGADDVRFGADAEELRLDRVEVTADNEIARLQYPSTEYDLSRTLGYATGFVTPLSDKGEPAWPKPGDVASFNLLPASCSAEAVARLPVRNAVFHKGRLVHGAVPKAV